MKQIGELIDKRIRDRILMTAISILGVTGFGALFVLHSQSAAKWFVETDRLWIVGVAVAVLVVGWLIGRQMDGGKKEAPVPKVYAVDDRRKLPPDEVRSDHVLVSEESRGKKKYSFDLVRTSAAAPQNAPDVKPKAKPDVEPDIEPEVEWENEPEDGHEDEGGGFI